MCIPDGEAVFAPLVPPVLLLKVKNIMLSDELELVVY